MTREQIEEAIDRELDSIVFDEDGGLWHFESGDPVTDAELARSMLKVKLLEFQLARLK